MSQSTAVRTPRAIPRTAPAPAPPRLRVVSVPGRTRSRAGLAVGCVALLVVALVGLLLLNISLERGAYVLRDQQTRGNQLQDRKEALEQQLQALQAPPRLADEGRRMGLVPAPNSAFIKPDGKVLGEPRRAAAKPAPTVTKPSAGAQAQGAGRTAGGGTSGRPGATARD